MNFLIVIGAAVLSVGLLAVIAFFIFEPEDM